MDFGHNEATNPIFDKDREEIYDLLMPNPNELQANCSADEKLADGTVTPPSVNATSVDTVESIRGKSLFAIHEHGDYHKEFMDRQENGRSI